MRSRYARDGAAWCGAPAQAREAALVDANATVKLLFQPGEETFEGARAAIANGLLENPRPQAAFAMHVNSQSPLGLVLYGSPALSGVYGFRITLQGKGGHGSSPEICIDPITAGVHVHLALQELIAREVPAAKEVALTVGKFAGGQAANVIPDTCVLEGTLRGFDVELMEHLKTRIAEVVKGVATTYRTPATIETLSDVPPLVLDDDMTQASLGYVGATLPKAAFLPLFHAMASEDFALISSEIPSAYFTFGAAVTDTDEHFAQHHPKARFSDAELPLAPRLMRRSPWAISPTTRSNPCPSSINSSPVGSSWPPALSSWPRVTRFSLTA